ncbi:MAG TPA: hypothetical protein VKP65_16150 [Rhodothermales bacterium]|nr:hypothetical protein [Rhodothermales bacterium]
MKRSTGCTGVLLSLMVLFIGVGCGSPVPISDAENAPFDEQLVGRWQATQTADETVDMLILQFNDREYYVELREVKPDPSNEEILRLRAYITDVDGHRFINAQTIQDEREYYFYTYALEPNGRLMIQELRDVEPQKINEFESSEALLTFVRQNVDNPALYGETTSLVRMPMAN